GIASLFSQVRASRPTSVLMGNGDQFTNYSTANGQELYDPTDWTDMSKYGGMMASYHQHISQSYAPQISFLHPNTPAGAPSLQVMRFGLPSALMDNGVFVYDQGATQEGTPWWFDEYDNGAGTALTSGVGATGTSLPVVNSGLFHIGDTVEVEDELMR